MYFEFHAFVVVYFAMTRARKVDLVGVPHTTKHFKDPNEVLAYLCSGDNFLTPFNHEIMRWVAPRERYA